MYIQAGYDAYYTKNLVKCIDHINKPPILDDLWESEVFKCASWVGK